MDVAVPSRNNEIPRTGNAGRILKKKIPANLSRANTLDTHTTTPVRAYLRMHVISAPHIHHIDSPWMNGRPGKREEFAGGASLTHPGPTCIAPYIFMSTTALSLSIAGFDTYQCLRLHRMENGCWPQEPGTKIAPLFTRFPALSPNFAFGLFPSHPCCAVFLPRWNGVLIPDNGDDIFREGRRCPAGVSTSARALPRWGFYFRNGFVDTGF